MRLYSLSIFLLLSLFGSPFCLAQHSVARQWNEVLLEAIRGDFARPTVHARNLFHTSVALYDAWAVYEDSADTYLLGKTHGEFTVPFEAVDKPENIREAQETAMSYAAYRLLSYRFQKSPGFTTSFSRFFDLMSELGYDESFTDTDYTSGSPAALGNYIAQQLIAYGLQDGANEENEYANEYYTTINPPLVMAFPGNPDIVDMNRWQPLTLDVFIDQSGFEIPFNTPPFLSPEWGNVTPFAMTADDRTSYERAGDTFQVYHDPGPPPYLIPSIPGGSSAEYKWGFCLVSVWASHMDPADSVIWDISPASIGNVPSLSTSIEALQPFYDLEQGGDPSIGHMLNPHTGEPYEPQYVPRADYARVLAEFWADGPDSETPPGHWFTILNYVNDHPELEKRFKGEGPILDDLEWDVKSYLALGGAMHDAAIAAWSVKGWYDYIRPVSAIRAMAEKGQSTDASLPNFDVDGITLIPGFIEVVQEGDTLAGEEGEHIGKIKLYTWRGPDYIEEPETDMAGVGWILAENWWPYQRPSFVTPPFAGYVSGHSTFSRTAAEILTFFTGDEYFPGGMGEFEAPRNEFLVFEEGPSTDLVLQWATYRDASDQCSLSRIWGGIHPPADDIMGRLMGKQIGVAAFEHAEKYFTNENQLVSRSPRLSTQTHIKVSPNPVSVDHVLSVAFDLSQPETVQLSLLDIQGRVLRQMTYIPTLGSAPLQVSVEDIPRGLYLLHANGKNWKNTQKVIIK